MRPREPYRRAALCKPARVRFCNQCAARRKIAGLVVRLDKALAEELPLVFDFLGVADPPRRMDPDAPPARLGAPVKRLKHAKGFFDTPNIEAGIWRAV